MWYFGVDSIDEYTGKEFHVTFEDGMSDLFRIYTKRMENNKQTVRAEHQAYPNEDVAYALCFGPLIGCLIFLSNII